MARPAGVCRACGGPVGSGLGSEAPGRQHVRREASKVVRVLGASFVVILNVVALWLAIGLPVAYVTQGSPAQLGADYVPLWATIFIAITCGSVPVITLVAWAVHRRSRARARRATASDSPVLGPGWVTICLGQGLFLRADDAGVLVRNFYFGRRSRLRIAWAEISHFADGA